MHNNHSADAMNDHEFVIAVVDCPIMITVRSRLSHAFYCLEQGLHVECWFCWISLSGKVKTRHR